MATAEGVSTVGQQRKNWFSYWHLYLDVAHHHLRHGHGSGLVQGALVEDSWSRFRFHDSIPSRQRRRTRFVWALQTAPAARYREGADEAWPCGEAHKPIASPHLSWRFYARANFASVLG